MASPTATGYTVDPRWTLFAIFLTLVGLLGLAGLLYGVKFHGVSYSFAKIPTRDLFVFLLGLTAAPLLLTLFHRVPTLLLLLPIAFVLLLYPLFNPFGIPYSRDPIFNFQFASTLLQSGHWVPAALVTEQAGTYTYFPGSGVFNAETSVLTGVPLATSFLWGIPLLHLLVLPAAVYSIGKVWFGPRIAWGGVLFYLGTPSILFNLPVQQEFAIPFFTLTLLALSLLFAPATAGEATGLRVGIVLFSSFVVVSHHLTSYFLAAWLAALVVVPYLIGGARERGIPGPLGSRRRTLVGGPTSPEPEERSPRSGFVFARYFLVFAAYTLFVSATTLSHNLTLLGQVLSNLILGVAPSSRIAAVGQSFPLYQQLWIYLAIGGLVLVSAFVARSYLTDRRSTFLVANLVVAAAAILATLPFLATEFGFLSLRGMEFCMPFAAPAFAWWLVYRLRPWLAPRLARLRLPGPLRIRRLAAPLVVLALAGLIFTAGGLVPVDVRDQFAAREDIPVDSPLHVGAASYSLGLWARGHLNTSSYLWGDYLAYSVFGGFGRFQMRYDQFGLFNGTNITPAAWRALSPGDFVVTDRYMTQVTPEFPGPTSHQPIAPLTAAQLAKFDLPPYFDLVYADSEFTIYEFLHPPPGL